MQGRTPPRTLLCTSRFPKLSERFILSEALGLEARAALSGVLSLAPTWRTDAVEEADTLRTRVHYPPPRVYLKALPAASGGAASFKRTVARECGEVLARLAADLGADVIHAHWATWPLVAACRAKKITGLPTGIAVHAYDLYLSDVDALASRLTEVDYIVVNNEYNREWIRAHLPADVVAKTHVIHDSVAVPETAPDEGERSSNLILAVGRLVPFKGFDVLLRALRILRDRSVAFHAVIVGDGPSRRNLARLAKDLVLANCISFTGALPNLAVRELMKKATVLVVPSIEPAAGSHDGLPYVIPEALSLRLPVVATNVAAIGEAIRDHDTGLLVPPEDAARLAEAIAAILAQPELRTRVVRGGAALVRERFNEERNIDRLVALQCDLLDARRRD